MLELAIYNQELLFSAWKKALNDGLFRYMFGEPVRSFVPIIEMHDGNIIQYVSKSTNGNIIGYFSAFININCYFISNLNIVHFGNSESFFFIKDLINFLDYLLLERNYKKVQFHVYSGNPALKIYVKLEKKYNICKKVAHFKENAILEDGFFHDEIVYEIYKETYTKLRQIFKRKATST